MNMKAAFLEVVNDALGSVAVMSVGRGHDGSPGGMASMPSPVA